MRLSNLALHAALSCTLAIAQTTGQSTFDPTRPPAIPLAVRSPYLSTWQSAGSDGGNGGYLAGEWPIFWTGNIVGWTGMNGHLVKADDDPKQIRVDEATYTWMGAPIISGDSPPPVVNQTAFSYTSTRSVFEMDVGGKVNMTITFLSNVSPNDMMRQSFPFSYMEVSAASLDGADHAVQIYTDVSGEWASGDRSEVIRWDYDVIQAAGAAPSYKQRRDAGPQPTAQRSQDDELVERQAAGDSAGFRTYGTRTEYTGWRTAVRHPATDLANAKTSSFVNPQPTEVPSPQGMAHAAPAQQLPKAIASGGVAYHNFSLETQLVFNESNDQAQWGTWYYVTQNTANLTHQSGADRDVRGQFLNNGDLLNTMDDNFRAINDSFPVFAFAVDYGQLGTTPQSTLWAISHAQNPAVEFEGANGNQTLNNLWTEYFPTDLDAIDFYYNDYATAGSQATDLDNMIKSDSDAAGGPSYSLLTTLAVRQAFGALAWTNTSANPLVFVKELSSNGDAQTVDIIFPFHPIALYLNPDILRYVLDPLFINQEAGFWPFQYAIHDIGTFPNATGHSDGNAEMQPLEECGNMIIMALAYAQRKSDNDYLNLHYDILRQWNDYLIMEALIPNDQISTDDFAGSLANQTNLAIKGIIGIEAMAQIANRTNHADDGANFTNIAHDYVTQFQTLGIAMDANPPHTTLSYGDNETHGLLYNIFADKELGLQLVPQSIFDMQSAYYPTLFNEYGVPLDTRHTYTKASTISPPSESLTNDWEVWVASVASKSTMDQFFDVIARWVGVTSTNLPLTDLYETITGAYPENITFVARPVVGGYFALLALQTAPDSGFVVPGGGVTCPAKETC